MVAKNTDNHKRRVYLDYAATSPVDPLVVEAMLPCFSVNWGNPSSLYQSGRDANFVMETSREDIARVLHCKPAEVIFTSGGTESDNLALKGVAWQARQKAKGNHIIISAIEHHAVLHAAEYLQDFGFEVTLVPVTSAGLVEPAAVEQAIRPGQTVLVSVMYANNEIGTVQPLAEISKITRAHNIFFHTDAVQAPGQLSLDVQQLGVDLLSLSSHKFYGPKGVGVLYVRQGTSLLYQQQGGSQERRRRAGTENVPYIVGTAKALQLVEANRTEAVAHLRHLRDKLKAGILAQVAEVQVNGSLEDAQRLAGNLNLSFAGVEGEGLLQALDLAGIEASNGSACNVGSVEPSHVLKALGLPDEQTAGTLRFSLGKFNSEADIAYVLEKLPGIIVRMRALANLNV
jgi:cysteine desulfurase